MHVIAYRKYIQFINMYSIIYKSYLLFFSQYRVNNSYYCGKFSQTADTIYETSITCTSFDSNRKDSVTHTNIFEIQI